MQETMTNLAKMMSDAVFFEFGTSGAIVAIVCLSALMGVFFKNLVKN